MAAGTGDNMAAALGLDLGPGDVLVSIGTSGVASTVSSHSVADGTGVVTGFADAAGGFLPMVTTMNAAGILDLQATWLGVDHDELAALALSAPPGSNGVTLLPYYGGERTPNRPDAVGTWTGLTPRTTRADLARAAFEALLCSLADAVDALLAATREQPRRVLLVGGAARSPAVRELAPAILGRPVALPPPGEYVARGAARQAAWALSGATPSHRLGRCRTPRRSRPSPPPPYESGTPSSATIPHPQLRGSNDPPDFGRHPGAHARRQVLLRAVDRGLAGARPLWQGHPAADRPVYALDRLAGIGAYGVNFHDDDLIPFGSDDNTRETIIDRFKKGLADTGLVVTTATTNLFSHPVFKDGGFTNNDRDVRRFAIRKVIRNIDLAAELGAKVYVAWGGREGAEYGASKDVPAALDRYQEAFNLLGEYVVDRGYDLRFAIEPKPNEPRGDILLPTVGHALAFIETLDRPELVGVNPEVGHEEMAGLNAAAGYAQALWHGKLFHIDLNGQNGPKYDQDLRFGAGNARGAFWVVDTLLAGGYDGPVHFDFKPARTEDDDGVWVSAKACMDNYLILREKVQAFRAYPKVIEALDEAKLPELAQPTLGEGESWEQLLAWPLPDLEAIATRGAGFERLDQLALEHLYGVRG